MGRILRVSKSFPAIISSNRVLFSGEKPISNSAFSLPQQGNGDLRQHNLLSCEGSLPLPARRVLGQEIMARVYRRGVMFARCRSSGTDHPSDSEWPETDDEEQGIYETEDEEDAETWPPSKEWVERRGSPDRSRRSVRGVKSYSKDSSSGRSYYRDSDSDYVEVESDLEGELQEEIERQMAAEPKFTRPSITWGILLTAEQQRTAKANVLQYLDAEGINTTELARVELPMTVEVMQTRLGFLRKLGLDNEAINNYPLVLGCSVQKNMVPVLKYLKKIGVPQYCIQGFLRKYPMILHASVVIDILPVIYFLRGLDIHPIDIPAVIVRYPDLLGFKPEGTMSTSVAYLVSIGVCMRHVGRMLTEYPEILGMRVACALKPKVEYLIGLGIPQMIVTKMIERRPHILGYDMEHRMKFNVSKLLELGVRQEAIPRIVAQFPDILGRVFTLSIGPHVEWLKESLKLDTDGIARIIEKMPQVIFMEEDVATERIRFLIREGFARKDIGVMVTGCPQILILSIERLRPNIIFLLQEMKRSRKELIGFPAYLTYDLETRIKPRFKALTDGNAQCSLEWLLNCSDREYQKRKGAGFVSNEEAGLVFVMGGPLPGRLTKDEDEWQPLQQLRFAAL